MKLSSKATFFCLLKYNQMARPTTTTTIKATIQPDMVAPSRFVRTESNWKYRPWWDGCNRHNRSHRPCTFWSQHSRSPCRWHQYLARSKPRMPINIPKCSYKATPLSRWSRTLLMSMLLRSFQPSYLQEKLSLLNWSLWRERDVQDILLSVVLPGLVAGNDLIGKSVVDHGSNVSRVGNSAVSSH